MTHTLLRNCCLPTHTICSPRTPPTTPHHNCLPTVPTGLHFFIRNTCFATLRGHAKHNTHRHQQRTTPRRVKRASREQGNRDIAANKKSQSATQLHPSAKCTKQVHDSCAAGTLVDSAKEREGGGCMDVERVNVSSPQTQYPPGGHSDACPALV